MEKEIQSYIKYFTSSIKVKQIFYRARTGYSKVLKKKDFDYLIVFFWRSAYSCGTCMVRRCGVPLKRGHYDKNSCSD